MLDIAYFPPPHCAEFIAEKINEILCEWGLENKILALTTDNGPNIIKAAKILEGETLSFQRLKTDFTIDVLHTIYRE